MTVAAIQSMDDLLCSDQVPSLPEVALRVIQIAQQPDPDTRELIRTIRTDPAIAGRVLKFANSALFGLRNRPSSIEAAVPMLGTTLVRTLVLGFTLARQTKTTEALQPWFRQLWRESLFQAAAAEYLAERSGSADAPTWFLGALLQDVGQLALLNAFETEYAERVLEVENAESRVEREQRAFGFTHVDISVALVRRWNLETSLVDAIAAHHKLPAGLSPRMRSDIKFGLSAASACAEYMDAVSDRLEATRTDVERCLVEVCGVIPHDVYPVLAEIDIRSAELAGGFSVDIGSVPPRERLLAMAQSTLRKISMEEQLRMVDRRVASAAAHISEEVDDDSPCEQWREWLDTDTSVYNVRYLQSALPMQITKAHTEGVVTGVMEVCLLPFLTAHDGVCDLERVSRILLDSVRPADHVARLSDHSFAILVSGLNHDMLAQIANDLQSRLAEVLDLPDGADDSPVIGGVVVVSSSRKPATPDLVMKTLAESTATANRQQNRIHFQLVVGNKVEHVPAIATDHRSNDAG
ncbi:MAG: HDOD domain-containing protein [Planctomycetaceae bacterium]|nr:HDOD domain-containing protein [Planctomycetaceae bacterium]